ncbi:MAG: FAD:protein FMN transferase [Bacteroidota bacterium]
MYRLWIFMMLLVLASCQNEAPVKQEAAALPYGLIEGRTMGTYYRVTYADAQKRDFKAAIDQLLLDINAEVSTYEPNSLITQFNNNDAPFEVAGEGHFSANIRSARAIYAQTGGAFDPTVMPLINYWGFGTTAKQPVMEVDSQKVAGLLELVGFDRLSSREEGEKVLLKKPRPGVQLDFSAIAKGYAVDEVGRLLEKEGIKDYLIDIGGELVARGKNRKGDWWQLGIRTPTTDASVRDIEQLVRLQNKGMATSGNYENYYEVEGEKYGHTINPKTGYPEISKLLSATVIAEDCITADAFATAFMVLGLEKAFELASQTEEIEACFIYGNENSGMSVMLTEGMKSIIRPAN